VLGGEVPHGGEQGAGVGNPIDTWERCAWQKRSEATKKKRRGETLPARKGRTGADQGDSPASMKEPAFCGHCRKGMCQNVSRRSGGTRRATKRKFWIMRCKKVRRKRRESVCRDKGSVPYRALVFQKKGRGRNETRKSGVPGRSVEKDASTPVKVSGRGFWKEKKKGEGTGEMGKEKSGCTHCTQSGEGSRNAREICQRNLWETKLGKHAKNTEEGKLRREEGPIDAKNLSSIHTTHGISRQLQKKSKKPLRRKKKRGPAR